MTLWSRILSFGFLAAFAVQLVHSIVPHTHHSHSYSQKEDHHHHDDHHLDHDHYDHHHDSATNAESNGIVDLFGEHSDHHSHTFHIHGDDLYSISIKSYKDEGSDNSFTNLGLFNWSPTVVEEHNSRNHWCDLQIVHPDPGLLNPPLRGPPLLG